MEHLDSIVGWFSKYGKSDPFAILGLVLGTCAYVPYLWDVFTNKNCKPAISSWFLWSLLTILTFTGQLKSGKVYPQTVMYLFLDPVVLISALIKRNWSPLEGWDWAALFCGVVSGLIMFFSPADSVSALMGSLVGICFANIPIIKNILKDPLVESLAGWILFTFAGTCSLLSGIIYFTGMIDLATPGAYLFLCTISLGTLLVGRRKLKRSMV